MSNRAIFKPLYIEKQVKVRALAGLLEGGLLVLESGVQLDEVRTAEEIINLLFQENLLLFVRSFTDLPEKDQFFLHSKMTYCNKEGRILAIKFQGAKRKTHWIVEVADWGYAVPVCEVLKALRITYNHAGVGVQNTTGGLGQALIRKSLKTQYKDDWYKHRHRRPGQPTCDILRLHSFGARQDAIDTLKYDLAYELDMKNAYSFHFRKLPTGICSRTYKEEAWKHLTFFAPVNITIKTPLKLGLFPIRRNEDKSISYPTEVGTYDTWLWREHCEFLKEQGLSLRITGAGIAWEEFTTDMAAWSIMMEELRDTAPNSMTALHMKLATVAGIGRENMPDRFFTIIDGGEWGDDTPLMSDGDPWDFMIHEEIDERPNNLPHWFYYCVAMMCLALTKKAYEYADYLIGTATDAIYVRADAPWLDQYPDKDDTTLNPPSGTWRRLRHTNVQRWNLGRFKSDQKTVMTGVKREHRESQLKKELAG